jgi:hypothetical protein
MMTRPQIKLVRECQYVAEVKVELIDEKEGWAPYFSLEDAEKLDAVRKGASSRRLTPLARPTSIGRR